MMTAPLTISGTAMTWEPRYTNGHWVRASPASCSRWTGTDEARSLPIRLQHKGYFPLKTIGPVQLWRTATGLECEFTLAPGRLANDLQLALQYGWFNGLSVTYAGRDNISTVEVLDDDPDVEATITIERLLELSIVDWPGCPGALIRTCSTPVRLSTPTMPEDHHQANRLRSFLDRIGYLHERPPSPPLPIRRKKLPVARPTTPTRPSEKPAAPAKPKKAPYFDILNDPRIRFVSVQSFDVDDKRLMAARAKFIHQLLRG